MATFSSLVDDALSSGEALRFLEDSALDEVATSFAKNQVGLLPDDRLLAQALAATDSAFLSAGALAQEHMEKILVSEGLEHTASKPEVAPVLERFRKDIKRNFATYAESEKTEADFRRLRYRVRLSVQASVRRGFLENQMLVARKLRKKGYAIRKVWMANLSQNHSPCAWCRALHGTQLPLLTEFSKAGLKVLDHLHGPPRHPNCRCTLLVYVMTLSTTPPAFQSGPAPERRTMTAKQVRQMPRAVFSAVVATLRAISARLRGSRDR